MQACLSRVPSQDAGYSNPRPTPKEKSFNARGRCFALADDNSWRPLSGAYLLILTTPSSLSSTAMAAGESSLDEELAALTFEIEGGGYNNGGGQEGGGGLVPRDGRRGGRSMAPGSKNVVCIHYLVGMCALDKDCPYLHQYDLDRVPICPYVLGREDGGDACRADDGHLSDLKAVFPTFPIS